MHKIEISDRTYRRLLGQSVSFEDTPERVIERLLNRVDEGASSGVREAPESPAATRATPGSIVPEREYWLPILRAIAEAGGSAAATDVIDAVGAAMAPQFKARDLDVLSLGEIRWRNRARFARLRMKEQGYLSDRSPRGVWEITPSGRALLENG